MTTQMRLLCFAAVTLLAEAQMIPGPFIFPLKNFRPLLDQLRVEAVYPEGVDLSIMSVKKMTFPAQELDCSQVNTSMPGQQCPLKENGKIMNCNFTLSYINQDADIQGFQFNCDAAIKEATLTRVRRSRSGRGSGKGGRGGSRGSSRSWPRRSRGSKGSSGSRGSRGSSGSRGSRGGLSGRGSSIAGIGNRNSGGTRTA
uniref:Cathelicidin 1 n=2 Tax=Gadus TaxID=8048 RepID=A0A0D3MJC7_GADMO|nr:cathelicidin 1 [Gadus morhua]AIL25604.1 cathelicidin 1 [Gadus macrocephalus]